MTKTSSSAIAAILVAALGFTAVPAAFAQDTVAPASPAATPMAATPMQGDGGGFEHMRGVRQGRGGMMDLVCSDKGAEALEIGFVRLSHAIDLTDTQQPLFDDLKTTALAAQADYAAACTTARGPVATDTTTPATAPDLIDRLTARIAIDTAEIDALSTVLPKLEAFYDSLTAEQQAALGPMGGRGFGGPGMKGHGGMKGGDMQGEMKGPGMKGGMKGHGMKGPGAPGAMQPGSEDGPDGSAPATNG